jgi:hypothetical protein
VIPLPAQMAYAQSFFQSLARHPTQSRAHVRATYPTLMVAEVRSVISSPNIVIRTKSGAKAKVGRALTLHSIIRLPRNEANAFGTEGVELARVPLDSDTVLINRRRYILHPRGVKFTSASVAGDSPTNAELENGANWARVFENKNVRIVAIEHNN